MKRRTKTPRRARTTAIPNNPREDQEKGDSTQALRRIYAKRFADYIEDQIKLLWSGDMEPAQAISLVRTLGDPTRRDMYLRTLWWAEKSPTGMVRRGKSMP